MCIVFISDLQVPEIGGNDGRDRKLSQVFVTTHFDINGNIGYSVLNWSRIIFCGIYLIALGIFFRNNQTWVRNI